MVLGKTRFGGFFFVHWKVATSLVGASLLRAAFRRWTSTITRAVWKNAPLLSPSPATGLAPTTVTCDSLPNGQSLTPERCYVLCLCFTKTHILDPSTE